MTYKEVQGRSRQTLIYTSIVIALQTKPQKQVTEQPEWAHSPDKTYYIKWTGPDRPTSADEGFLGGMYRDF